METHEPQSNVNAALIELAAIEGQIRATGAVDSEPGHLAGIRRDILSGRTSPDAAIAAARKMLAARNAYH